jgi:hypothetical protein
VYSRFAGSTCPRVGGDFCSFETNALVRGARAAHTPTRPVLVQHISQLDDPPLFPNAGFTRSLVRAERRRWAVVSVGEGCAYGVAGAARRSTVRTHLAGEVPNQPRTMKPASAAVFTIPQ